jgi:hypothetical protein
MNRFKNHRLASDRVTAYEPGGREFESLRARQFIKYLTAAEHLALSNIQGCVRGAPWCNECADGQVTTPFPPLVNGGYRVGWSTDLASACIGASEDVDGSPVEQRPVY